MYVYDPRSSRVSMLIGVRLLLLLLFFMDYTKDCKMSAYFFCPTLSAATPALTDFSGAQLTALKTDRLVSNDVFTSYTDEQGEWLTISEGGDPITQTVWTR